jgi:hypothetical protein
MKAREILVDEMMKDIFHPKAHKHVRVSSRSLNQPKNKETCDKTARCEYSENN